MTERGIYVYGLVPAGAIAQAPGSSGVGDAPPVELICQRDVTAVVSRVDLDQYADETLRANLADMDWVERMARRHQQVLDQVIEHCTPIPMRLCTVYRDEAGLREMLEREHEQLVTGLRQVASKLEFGLKAFALSGGGRSAGSPAPVAAASSGTAYLQGRLAQRSAGAQRRAEQERACDDVHGVLCALATASRLNPLHRPQVSGRERMMLINASYLVANEQRQQFCGRVQTLRDELPGHGVELELTGPWPPYNFVPAAFGGLP